MPWINDLQFKCEECGREAEEFESHCFEAPAAVYEEKTLCSRCVIDLPAKINELTKRIRKLEKPVCP